MLLYNITIYLEKKYKGFIMDERRDLRSLLAQTRIGNTDQRQDSGNAAFDTEDLIFLESYDEAYRRLTKEERRVSPTDYAKMHMACVYPSDADSLDHTATMSWTRSAYY